MPKAVVLTDTFGYYDDDGDRQDVEKGAEVDLSQKDYDRHLEAGNIRAPGGGGYPRTHDGLDDLAATNPDFAFSADDLTVAQKRDELEAAGITPDES